MGTNVLMPENSVPIVRGQSKSFKLRVFDLTKTSSRQDCCANTDPPPYPLTGVSIFLSVRREVYDQIPSIFKTSTSGQIVVTDIKGGVARVFFVPADTHDLDPGYYEFAVWLVLPTGDRVPVIEGGQLQILSSAMRLPL